MKSSRAYRDVRERATAALDPGSSVAEIARSIHSDIPSWPSQLQAAYWDALEAQVNAIPDATLAAHFAQWQQTHGIQVSQSTMSRLLHQLGFTCKKRP